MATVKGPLFSLDARGQVGGAVVFGYWKGRNYVRRHAVPSNPQSVSQVGMRVMLKFLSQIWQSRSEAQQSDWADLAAQKNISPFNAMVGYNMARWRNMLYPALLYPATEDDDVGTLPTLVATAGTRQITLTIGLTAIEQNYGAVIFRNPTTTFTPSWNNAVQVLRFESGTEKTWIDTPLAVGVEQFYMMVLFSKTGVPSAASAEDSATPT